MSVLGLDATTIDWQPTGDQSRSVLPRNEGVVDSNGVPIFYEVYDETGRDDAKTILFVPGWAIIHGRMWKAQVGYFSRHFRVITYDPRGNGKSGRPDSIDAYSDVENVRDIESVLDATGTERAFLVGLSRGAPRSLQLAATRPARVEAMVFLAAGTMLSDERVAMHGVSTQIMQAEGLDDAALEFAQYFNLEAWRRDPAHHRKFLVKFFEQFFEPHSTKEFEDALGWALEMDPQSLAYSHLGWQPNREETRALCEKVQCPTLVVHGTVDGVIVPQEAEALARELGTRLEWVEGSSHGLQARKPVQVNHAIREHLDPAFERRPAPRASRGGPPRALFVSSPIGLGHAQRDVAIARELRKLRPELEIDWLAQHPVTRVLEGEGERIHPASRSLASESAHIECESAEHDLHCFQAIRRMDEILIHNFMLYDDVMRDERYDLVIGDEAWELDYFLHENPGEKRAPFVWLTDFVGFLPMQEGGAHEAFLTADQNAEMIGHIAKHPEVRDRALFVGNPADVVPERFGPELPEIRAWTEEHFDFTGYVTGFDPDALGPRGELRERLGYREDEKVCIVSVGGSGVGESLLRKVIDAHPEARRREPALRTIVVAGPRIDPASLPSCEGLEVRPYVHNLYRHLAACDLAVVQGGLTTAMELTAGKRPFLYFPLKHHFEQNFHVRHRLDNYGAGRCMDYAAVSREELGAAMAREAGRPVDYRSVETDGAARAASRIAELLP